MGGSSQTTGVGGVGVFGVCQAARWSEYQPREPLALPRALTPEPWRDRLVAIAWVLIGAALLVLGAVLPGC